jgi:hypothetical protein
MVQLHRRFGPLVDGLSTAASPATAVIPAHAQKTNRGPVALDFMLAKIGPTGGLASPEN